MFGLAVVAAGIQCGGNYALLIMVEVNPPPEVTFCDLYVGESEVAIFA